MNMAGKTVLITGARRVGSDLARELARRGANLALTYLSSGPAIEALVAEIEQQGGKGLAIHADLTRPGDCASAVNAAVERFGRLDAFVSMASVYKRTVFDSLTDHDFDSMISANLAAAYHTSVHAAKVMRRQDPIDGIKGKIVFVGDWATERPYKDYLPYLVAKGGLRTLTLALARELAPFVQVNLALPAMIAPPSDFSPEETAAVVAKTPLQRAGKPSDLNNLILYLLEGTDFATGSCYPIDGGRFLGMDGDI